MTKTSDLIKDESEQGTDLWFKARMGIPTASNFSQIITSKGALSKSASKYMVQLAGERITGKAENSYTNSALQRGTELEPEARSYYELITGNDVIEVGCVYKDEKKDRSCSPDGLIGDCGGLEIKCPLISSHYEYLKNGKLPTAYYQQVQGSMYITGRSWWDFLSYYPGVRPLLVRVGRDVNFCVTLDKLLNEFIEELNSTVEFLKL